MINIRNQIKFKARENFDNYDMICRFVIYHISITRAISFIGRNVVEATPLGILLTWWRDMYVIAGVKKW